MRTHVKRVLSDSADEEWTITVSRNDLPYGNTPPRPKDVPADILIALIEWAANGVDDRSYTVITDTKQP